MAERIGNWMQTYTGRAFWPLDPRPEEIDIDDIATALSNICRFGGHCEFYSVAQHSVLVSRVCDPADARWGLLHDSSEAFCGDLIRPIKLLRDLKAYRRIEDGIHRAIATRFGLLPLDMPWSVTRADEILLATECRDLMGGERGGDWCFAEKPLDEVIVPMDPMTAKRAFLDRFKELTARAA